MRQQPENQGFGSESHSARAVSLSLDLKKDHQKLPRTLSFKDRTVGFGGSLVLFFEVSILQCE